MEFVHIPDPYSTGKYKVGKYPSVGVSFCTFCSETHADYFFSCRLCFHEYACKKQCFFFCNEYVCADCVDELHIESQCSKMINIRSGEMWDRFRTVDRSKKSNNNVFFFPCRDCGKIHRAAYGRCMFCETPKQCKTSKLHSMSFRWVCTDCVECVYNSIMEGVDVDDKVAEIHFNIQNKQFQARREQFKEWGL